MWKNSVANEEEDAAEGFYPAAGRLSELAKQSRDEDVKERKRKKPQLTCDHKLSQLRSKTRGQSVIVPGIEARTHFKGAAGVLVAHQGTSLDAQSDNTIAKIMDEPELKDKIKLLMDTNATK